MTGQKTDARDIFDKVLDEGNQYPAMGAIYGAALGGLAGEVLAKRFSKPGKTMKTHATHGGSVVGIPVGAVLGMEAGRQTLNRKRRVDEMKNGRRK